MSKWIIVIVSATMAGILGFICGAILTAPDRHKFDSAIQQYQQTQEVNKATIANHQREVSLLKAALAKSQASGI